MQRVGATSDNLLPKAPANSSISRAEEVAQIFQQDGSDLQEALNAYEKAGEWYDTESAPAYVDPF